MSCASLLGAAGRPAPFTVCEVGPGDGSLAAGLAAALADLPLDLVLCERAEGLAARQRDTPADGAPRCARRARAVTGAIVANEVHDACPAHVLRWPDELPRRRRTATAHFAWVVAGAAPETLRRIVERIGRCSATRPRAGGLARAGRAAGVARRTRGAWRGCSCSTTARTGPERYLRPVPAPAHVPRRPPGRRSARRAGSPGHHRRRRLRRRPGGRREPRVCAPCSTSRSRCGCGGTARSSASRRCRSGARSGSGSSRSPRDEASGASFRVLVQERV